RSHQVGEKHLGGMLRKRAVVIDLERHVVRGLEGGASTLLVKQSAQFPLDAPGERAKIFDDKPFSARASQQVGGRRCWRREVYGIGTCHLSIARAAKPNPE